MAEDPIRALTQKIDSATDESSANVGGQTGGSGGAGGLGPSVDGGASPIGVPTGTPGQAPFEMGGNEATAQTQGRSGLATPMELAQRAHPTGRLPTLDSSFKNINTNFTESRKQLNQIVKEEERLNPQGNEVTTQIGKQNSVLLQSKYDQIQSYLKAAQKIARPRAGEYQRPEAPPKGMTPGQHFLSLIVAAQDQINSVHAEMDTLGSKKNPMTTELMMKMQYKMNSVSQETEMFTGILNKCIDGPKQIMNVQV